MRTLNNGFAVYYAPEPVTSRPTMGRERERERERRVKRDERARACRLPRIEGKLLQPPTGEERRKPFHFPLDGRRKEGRGR